MEEFTLRVDFTNGKRATCFRFDLSKRTHRDIYSRLAQGLYHEAETTHLLFRMLKPGDVFIDIGAHLGYFSLLAAPLVGHGGLVVAVEPEDDNHAHLTGHIRINQFNNIIAVRQPLSDTIKACRFYIHPDNDGGHALWDVATSAAAQEPADPVPARIENVTTQTLDALVDELDLGQRRIKLIKIDAEGAETAIIKGGANTIAAHDIDGIIAEFNPEAMARMGTSLPDLAQTMRDMGYTMFLLHPNGELPKLVPPEVEIKADHIFNVFFTKLEKMHRTWQNQTITWDTDKQVHVWN